MQEKKKERPKEKFSNNNHFYVCLFEFVSFLINIKKKKEKNLNLCCYVNF